VWVAVGALVLTTAACGSASDIAAEGDNATTTTATTPTIPTTPTPTPTPTTNAPSADASLVMGLDSPPDLTRGACYSNSCLQVLSALYDPLFTIDRTTGVLVPEAAFGLEITAADTLRVTLRDDLTFHNGEPVDAASYVRGWNATAADEASTLAYYFAPVQGWTDVSSGTAETMIGLEALDATTIEIRFNGSGVQWAYLLANIAGFEPLSVECAQQTEACADQPIGNGPYELAAPYTAGSNLELTANEDYAGDRTGNVTELTFVPSSDSAAAYAAWQSGEVDLVDVDPVEVPAVGSAGPERLVEPTSTLVTLGLPTYVPGLHKPDVRRALSLAVDRDNIANQFFAGGRIPADDVLSSAVVGYESGRCTVCGFDPDEARALWDDAGGVLGNRLTLLYSKDLPQEKVVAQAMAAQWREYLDVDVNLQGVDGTTYFDRIASDRSPGPYRLSWIGDAPVAASYLDPELGPLDYTGYTSDQVTSLFEQAGQNTDLDASNELIGQLAETVAEDMPFLPLWSGATSYLLRDGLSAVRYDPARAAVVIDEIVVS